MAEDKKKQILENIRFIQEQNKLLQNENSIISNSIELQKRKTAETEIQSNNQLLYNEKLKLEEELKKENIKLSKDEKKEIDNINKSQTNINSSLSNETKLRQIIVNSIRSINGQLKIGWQFLQQQDKIIKSTILNLGMSGAKAEMMRTSFEQSAGYVARLGGTLEDVQSIMSGYADETGRARVLSAGMIENITAIGKGTGLGIEQATRLGSQFELMGYNAKATMDYVQGVVDTSERMGVNTSKVLKNINDNFKRLNTYTFQQGVKGFAQMAIYAEKFNMDINQALNAADVAKTLEGAIDLTSQLQIMGGEFAKTDPFEMLFLSRNDPAKFTEKIADMTKGVVTFRKMADGSFEKFISPADRDRLASVAKSLGMETSELTKISERQAEIQKMRYDMRGMGLSDEQRDLIEGAAVFNTSTGKFQAMIGGQMRDVTSLTKAQADGFVKERKSLEQRAKDSQTFDEAFKSTINELKSALLPILRGVNSVLTTVRPYVEKIVGFFTQGPLAWAKVAALFMGVGVAWKGILQPFMQRMGSATIGKLGNVVRGGGSQISKTVGSSVSETATSGAKGGGGKAFGKGAGIGAAMVGTGAGIMLAAEGIAKLADSMSKLNKDQIDGLVKIGTTLAITFPIAAIGITLAGKAAEASALGLIVLGGAIALVGGGIYLATTGIGNMAEGLSKLIKDGKGAGENMINLAGGVGALSVSMLGFTAGALGMLVFSNVMGTISKNAPAIAQVGEAFQQINAVMKGSREDFIAVENAIASISNSNVKSGGMFGELASLLKTPLKVEFANKDVMLNNNITLEIDGQKLMNKSYNVDLAIQKHEALKNGKS